MLNIKKKSWNNGFAGGDAYTFSNGTVFRTTEWANNWNTPSPPLFEGENISFPWGGGTKGYFLTKFRREAKQVSKDSFVLNVASVQDFLYSEEDRQQLRLLHRAVKLGNTPLVAENLELPVVEQVNAHPGISRVAPHQLHLEEMAVEKLPIAFTAARYCRNRAVLELLYREHLLTAEVKGDMRYNGKLEEWYCHSAHIAAAAGNGVYLVFLKQKGLLPTVKTYHSGIYVPNEDDSFDYRSNAMSLEELTARYA